MRVFLVFALLPLPALADGPLPVQLLTVAAAPDRVEYRLAGVIEAPETTSVAFRDGGRVVSVAVQPGDRLAKGDEIARIDPTQAQAALAAASAQARGAEAALTEAASAEARSEAQLASGVATRAELDAARQRLAAALSARDQALVQVSKARRAVEDTVLAAPADAIVTARRAEPGQVAGPGQTVVTIASGARRVAVFYAPDSADLSTFIGRDIALTQIDGDLTLRARLSEVSPLVDAATGTVRVKAEILDPPADPPLLGVPVLGRVMLENAAVFHLPWEALTSTAKGPAVWRADPATHAVALAPVTIAAYAESEVLVSDGLSAGDLVVGAGSQGLYPGCIVEAAP